MQASFMYITDKIKDTYSNVKLEISNCAKGILKNIVSFFFFYCSSSLSIGPRIYAVLSLGGNLTGPFPFPFHSVFTIPSVFFPVNHNKTSYIHLPPSSIEKLRRSQSATYRHPVQGSPNAFYFSFQLLLSGERRNGPICCCVCIFFAKGFAVAKIPSNILMLTPAKT